MEISKFLLANLNLKQIQNKENIFWAIPIVHTILYQKFGQDINKKNNFHPVIRKTNMQTP